MTDKEIEGLLSEARRQTEARAVLRGRLDTDPSTLAYLKWHGKLPDAPDPRPVTCIASFTIETIRPFLEVEAYLSDWRAEFSFIQYGLWRNALLDPAMLDRTGPEACILLLHTDALLPPDRTADQSAGNVAGEQLASAIKAFRKHRSTPLFIGLAGDPPSLDSLAFGESSRHGRALAVAGLREGIAAAAEDHDEIYLLDLPGWSAQFGEGWYDRKGYLANLSLVSHKALPKLARGIARTVGCLFKPRRRVLVLDLDDTLWGGVVGEDGAKGVALGEDWPGSAFVAFQHQLWVLRESGILLAINSKNNEADAREVFGSRSEMVLRWDDFSAGRINWDNKADNLVALAEELGLGLDSFVFADDSAMECALVRESLPQVEVVELGRNPAEFMGRILSRQAFDTLSLSHEDRARADNYKAEKRRKAASVKIGDLGDFFANLNLRLEIAPVESQTIERAHQLIAKTNQFNLSLRRHSREAVGKLAAIGGSLFIVALTDRFGVYGKIAVLHLRENGKTMEIVDLLISCRALGRQVGEALLAFARTKAAESGMRQLTARYAAGPRNQQVSEFLERNGFTATERTQSEIVFMLALDGDRLPWPEHIDVHTEGRKAEAS